MVIQKTEDEVRNLAGSTLGFTQLIDGNVVNVETDQYISGVGQLTTFNQLGLKLKVDVFSSISDKPDGWYLPYNPSNTAIILETKASRVQLGDKQVNELLKNIAIASKHYNKIVGILYNGEDVRVFKNTVEIDAVDELQRQEYYISLYDENKRIDKEYIYELTAKINNCLHFDFGIKNLYHRMIFTACALVAKRYDALMVTGMDYSSFTNAIQSSINKALIRDKKQNQKLGLLLDIFSEIRMNLNVNSEEEKEQQHVKNLIGKFIEWVTDISDSLNSDEWRGEDVMGIFFNEFNRYKKKSEAGQVFTPEHITDFMYKILEVNKDDYVLDGTCGSGGFLVKAMANMIREAGGVQTDKATEIKSKQLYGIEFDREIYALACANMLIHKDGKTNLECMDCRYETAANWISKQKITKVLMNPPYENKNGCIQIVENVLDHVPPHTMCGFILPEKKLEKVPASITKRIMKSHRLKKVIKLPEDLFFGVGVSTSIFVFESGVPQNDESFFGCYMESDGLEVVKNKGRHDIHDKWPGIEDYWVKVVKGQILDDSVKWILPSEHLSYQAPTKPFEIYEEDFQKVALDYLLFSKRNSGERSNDKD